MKNVKMLQQYLPFTVLKHWASNLETNLTLQQYLPFTVLKHHLRYFYGYDLLSLQQYLPFTVLKLKSITFLANASQDRYNSTYRLRYWNIIGTSIYVNHLGCGVTTVLTVYGIETPLW